MTSNLTAPAPISPTGHTPSPVRRRPKAQGTQLGLPRYTPWLYILPALILIVGIIYVGIGYTGWISTQDWNGIDPVGKQIGFDNFLAIATDEVFWGSLGHVAIFGLITIIVQMALGLVLAVLLGGNAVFGKSVYKVIIFLPVVLAPAAVATAFREIMSPGGGLNALLSTFGIPAEGIAWLADPNIALYSLAVINIWQWTGLSFLLYQAAISQIDQNLFEAASIDGAGPIKTFFYVLLPQLKGTHATLALTGCIGALKTFDIVFLTTGGGPGRSTEFVTTYIYKEVILNYHAGYSAALSIVLLILALTLTAIQIRIYRFGED